METVLCSDISHDYFCTLTMSILLYTVHVCFCGNNNSLCNCSLVVLYCFLYYLFYEIFLPFSHFIHAFFNYSETSEQRTCWGQLKFTCFVPCNLEVQIVLLYTIYMFTVYDRETEFSGPMHELLSTVGRFIIQCPFLGSEVQLYMYYWRFYYNGSNACHKLIPRSLLINNNNLYIIKIVTSICEHVYVKAIHTHRHMYTKFLKNTKQIQTKGKMCLFIRLPSCQCGPSCSLRNIVHFHIHHSSCRLLHELSVS